MVVEKFYIWYNSYNFYNYSQEIAYSTAHEKMGDCDWHNIFPGVPGMSTYINHQKVITTFWGFKLTKKLLRDMAIYDFIWPPFFLNYINKHTVTSVFRRDPLSYTLVILLYVYLWTFQYIIYIYTLKKFRNSKKPLKMWLNYVE